MPTTRKLKFWILATAAAVLLSALTIFAIRTQQTLLAVQSTAGARELLSQLASAYNARTLSLPTNTMASELDLATLVANKTIVLTDSKRDASGHPIDHFGNRYKATLTSQPTGQLVLSITSAGPDRQPNTTDDQLSVTTIRPQRTSPAHPPG